MDIRLLKMAEDAGNNAYAPYSKFKVGAAVKGINGKIYTGCNIENASYPVGICAEVSAISAMINAGERKIAEMAICSDSNRLCPPCGKCRQFMSEFCDPNTPIHLFIPNGRTETYTLSQLLPHAFTF